MKQVIDNLSPKIIVLCETKLPSNTVLKKLLPAYEVNTRVTKSGQSGVAIAVKSQTFRSALDVTCSTHHNIITTRIELDNCAIRIILGYAPQETEPADVREHFFTELGVEATQCKLAGDLPIVIGDMNAKIVNISGKIVPESSNGRLFSEFIHDQELNVLNFDQRCQGKWTHVIRTSHQS